MVVNKNILTTLLLSKGCRPFGVIKEKDVWYSLDGVTIRLPLNEVVDIEEVEIILIEQLNMSMWDYDYWLGQNRIY